MMTVVLALAAAIHIVPLGGTHQGVIHTRHILAATMTTVVSTVLLTVHGAVVILAPTRFAGCIIAARQGGAAQTKSQYPGQNQSFHVYSPLKRHPTLRERGAGCK